MDSRPPITKLAHKVAIARSRRAGEDVSGIFSDILKTIPFQAVTILFWALLFSAIFNSDVFTQLALQEKSRLLGSQLGHSDDIVIIEFDRETIFRQGKEFDDVTHIFKLVETLLFDEGRGADAMGYKPKAIILDYALDGERDDGDELDKRKVLNELAALKALVKRKVLNEPEEAKVSSQPEASEKPDEPVTFYKAYLNKVVWGATPFQRGLDWHIEGISPQTFRYDCPDEEDKEQPPKPFGCAELASLELNDRYKPWGHLELELEPGSEQTVSHVTLMKSFGDYYLTADYFLPGLALSAYAMAEFQLKPATLVVEYLAILNEGKSSCDVLPIYNAKGCLNWERSQLFYTPPLPFYFPKYSALEFIGISDGADRLSVRKRQSRDESLKKLHNKYVIITSTWDQENDHYLTTNSTKSGALAKFIENFDVLSLRETHGVIPGAYFHATVLESLVNEDYPFPAEGTALDQFNYSLPVIVCAWIIAFLIRQLLQTIKHMLRESVREAYEEFIQGNLWIIILLFAVINFALFYHHAIYVVSELNVVVSFMWGYLISIGICSFYCAGRIKNEDRYSTYHH